MYLLNSNFNDCGSVELIITLKFQVAENPHLESGGSELRDGKLFSSQVAFSLVPKSSLVPTWFERA